MAITDEALELGNLKFGTEINRKHANILHIKYCDMTPERRNSPLLDNGSLTHVSMEMLMHGDRLDTERAFHINGINKQFPRIRASKKHFPWIRARLQKRNAEKTDSAVREPPIV
jgi:hypothetical protein